jgi:hypothetical protein
VFQNHRRNFVITAANGISGPKIEKVEECRCDGAEDRRSALVGVGKRGSLGQPSQRPLRPGVGSHPIEKISHKSSSYNSRCVGFNHAKCWSDERKMQKCKIHEGNVKAEKRLTPGGRLVQPDRKRKRDLARLA